MFVRVNAREIYKWQTEAAAGNSSKFFLQVATSESIRLQPKGSVAVLGVATGVVKRYRNIEMVGSADLRTRFEAWRDYHTAKDPGLMMGKASETARSAFAKTAQLLGCEV